MKSIFEFVHHNVLVDDMNDDKMEYMKFGKVGLNNHVSLLHSNILQRTHQQARFGMKKIFGLSALQALCSICARVVISN